MNHLFFWIIAALFITYVAALINWRVALFFAPSFYKVFHDDYNLRESQISEYAYWSFFFWPIAAIVVICKLIIAILVISVRFLFKPVTKKQVEYAGKGKRVLSAIHGFYEDSIGY